MRLSVQSQAAEQTLLCQHAREKQPPGPSFTFLTARSGMNSTFFGCSRNYFVSNKNKSSIPVDYVDVHSHEMRYFVEMMLTYGGGSEPVWPNSDGAGYYLKNYNTSTST